MNEVLKKKILIIDNDPGDILWFKKIINSHYVIIEPQDGLNALEMVKNEQPDLVLLDAMMPKIHGYSICTHLKSNPDTKDIQVVLVASLGKKINKKIIEEMGTAAGYLVKPVTPYQLLSTISRLLE